MGMEEPELVQSRVAERHKGWKLSSRSPDDTREAAVVSISSGGGTRYRRSVAEARSPGSWQPGWKCCWLASGTARRCRTGQEQANGLDGLILPWNSPLVPLDRIRSMRSCIPFLVLAHTLNLQIGLLRFVEWYQMIKFTTLNHSFRHVRTKIDFLITSYCKCFGYYRTQTLIHPSCVTWERA